MRIGSLFSGYGGLDMAVATVLGAEVAWHVEYDRAPSRILAHHYPEIPNYGDVTRVDFTTVEPVDVLTGGYPCQPFSHAGLRKGTDDERHLWPHVLRAIREMGPRFAILENVRGHLSLGFDVVLSDLADIGWSAEWVIIRASDAGACHQRARLFIVAYPERSRWSPAGLSVSRNPKGSGTSGNAERRNREGDHLPTDASGSGAGIHGTAGGRGRQSRGTHGPTLLRPQDGPIGADRLDPDGGAAADASGERHGRGQDAGMVGRVGATPEVIGRQASAARSQSGDRSTADAADANGGRRNRRPPQSQRGSQGRVAAAGAGQDVPADASGAGRECGGTPLDETRLCADPMGGGDQSSWGDYGPAIVQWERVIGRPAPRPTELGRNDTPRLAPAFVEWMMGLPEGWVTDPAIGISRAEQLKALGNGVVPQQAQLALSILLPRVRQYATAEEVVA